MTTEEHATQFWAKKLALVYAMFRDMIVVRVNHIHYMAHFGVNPGPFKGHGGAKFWFKFTDGPYLGEIVECTNVWCQGDIPKELWDEMPDNAVSLNPYANSKWEPPNYL